MILYDAFIFFFLNIILSNFNAELKHLCQPVLVKIDFHFKNEVFTLSVSVSFSKLEMRPVARGQDLKTPGTTSKTISIRCNGCIWRTLQGSTFPVCFVSTMKMTIRYFRYSSR